MFVSISSSTTAEASVVRSPASFHYAAVKLGIHTLRQNSIGTYMSKSIQTFNLGAEFPYVRRK